MNIGTRVLPLAGSAITLAATLASHPVTVHALQFEKGELSASWDTALSYGLSARVENRDRNLIGVANGGKGYSVNVDDGNLNYGKGKLFSNITKGTSELELNYRDVGAFIRGIAFYDYETEKGDTSRTDLSRNAKKLVGKNARLLDSYTWYRFDDGPIPGEVRVGKQVLSWGESTFIQNGINVINPVNVNALRVPGSDIKEALLPVWMASANLATSENTSLEGFYQWDWESTDPDPAGSYFAGNDFAVRAGDRVVLGRGTYPDGARPDGSFAPVEDTFQAIPRAKDDQPSNTGQYGVAFHVFAPALNDTEFGLFYIHNHSRLPFVNGVTGTLDGALAAGAIAGPPSNPTAGSGAQVAGTVALALAGGATPEQAIQQGVAIGQALGQTANQAAVISETTASEVLATGAPGAQTQGAVTDAAIDAFARTAFYKLEYPEDIKTFGASFNTQLGTTGWALQGEVSYHKDVPIQINTIEIIGGVLGGINPQAAQANQIGNFFGQFQTVVPGFIDKDIIQIQSTASRLFGPVAGADEAVLVGEVGLTHIRDYDNKNKGGPTGNGLRLNGPNTGLGGNPALAPTANQAFAGQVLDGDHFVSQNSWGYQIRGQLTFNNAIGPINLLPRLAWRHDVGGVSPGPGENFLEGRKAVSFGLRATYLSAWQADIGYTNFFGAGRYNLQNDRDFVAASLSYSF